MFRAGGWRGFGIRPVAPWIVLGLLLVGSAGSAAAQTRSGIVGIVTDTTGAALPGVTVETSSPALIEKIRSTVTDEAGQYRILDLPPGL